MSAICMNHHPHLEQPFLNHLNHLVHRVPPAVGSVPAAVWGTLKAVGVLKHHYVLCQHIAYLVAVAVATLATLNFRSYQEGVLHSFAGVGIRRVADRHGCPVGYLGTRRQSRMGSG